MKKRLLSILTCLMLAVTMIPATTFAAEQNEYVEIPEGLIYYDVNEDGTATVTGVEGSRETDFGSTEGGLAEYSAIPETVDGYRITAIGESAFARANAFESLKIPDSVTHIGKRAFYSCYVKNIEMSSELRTIDEQAFSEAHFKELIIPDTIEKIEYRAFNNTRIKNITFEGGNPVMGDEVFYSGSVESVTLSPDMTAIPKGMFYGCLSLDQIELHEGIETIGEEAFYQCGIKSIDVPDSVVKIDDRAFNSCMNLAVAKLGKNVQEMGIAVLGGCSFLLTVELPETISEIPGYTFGGCWTLKYIEIPEGVTKIGTSAFGKCEALLVVDMPDSVTQIGAGAFMGCKSLQSIELTDNITEIGCGAFENCSSIKSLEWPGSVKKVDEQTFKNCAGLKEVTIKDGVKEIGAQAFYGCNAMESLVIPVSVETIDDRAFVGYPKTVSCYKDSVAHDFLWRNSCKFKVLDCEHDYLESVNPATCEEKGNVRTECLICREWFDTELSALGHDASGNKEITEATCTEEGKEVTYCKRCNMEMIEIIPAFGHTVVNIPGEPATCTEAGKTEGFQCITCQEMITPHKTIPATGHVRVSVPAEPPTCYSDGRTAGTECELCRKVFAGCEIIPSPGEHSFGKWEVETPATTQKGGNQVQYCKYCGDIGWMNISRIQSTVLKAKTFAYTGKAIKPGVTVMTAGFDKLKPGTDYTVNYKNAAGTKAVTPKAVGTYKAVVTFKGKYSGSVARQFIINPKATSVTKLTKPGKKQFKVTWTKRTAQVTGYEIQYSTTKNFTKKTTKTLKVKNFKTNTKTIKQLKAKKKYWVKVRTYKNVNGNLYYSKWSPAKTIVTK